MIFSNHFYRHTIPANNEDGQAMDWWNTCICCFLSINHKPRPAGFAECRLLPMNKIMTNDSHRPEPSVRMLMLSIAGLIAASNAAASSVMLKSPDGKIVVTIQTAGHLSYGIAFHDKPVVEHSTLGLILDDKDLGAEALFAGRPEAREINEQYPVMGVHDTATNHCISTTIPVASGAAQWQLEFRVFNDGVACRYHVPAKGARHINGEATEWKVPVGSVLWFLG